MGTSATPRKRQWLRSQHPKGDMGTLCPPEPPHCGTGQRPVREAKGPPVLCGVTKCAWAEVAAPGGVPKPAPVPGPAASPSASQEHQTPVTAARNSQKAPVYCRGSPAGEGRGLGVGGCWGGPQCHARSGPPHHHQAPLQPSGAKPSVWPVSPPPKKNNHLNSQCAAMPFSCLSPCPPPPPEAPASGQPPSLGRAAPAQVPAPGAG